MIPEQAKSEIIRRKKLGATWTAIAKWVQEEYAVQVHRTTIQRWYDSEVWEEQEDSIPGDSLSERIKLDKKLATSKSEAAFYKKLYLSALKDDTKQDLIIETIQQHTKAFPSVPLKHIEKTEKTPFGHQAQIMVTPLSDTHIG